MYHGLVNENRAVHINRGVGAVVEKMIKSRHMFIKADESGANLCWQMSMVAIHNTHSRRVGLMFIKVDKRLAVYYSRLHVAVHNSRLHVAVYNRRLHVAVHNSRLHVTVHNSRLYVAVYHSRLHLAVYNSRLHVAVYNSRLHIAVHNSRLHVAVYNSS